MRYLDRDEIDIEKWDDVIAHSPAETLYPYSWYLDGVAQHWSALVEGDYRFIMPLIWKRKFGLRYLYQPFYTQQLGVFSKEFVDPLMITGMLAELPKRFRFASLSFNSKNLVEEKEPFTVVDRVNYVLDLGGSYSEIHDAFSMNARRNIKKAIAKEQEIIQDLSVRQLVEFKRKNDLIKRSESAYKWMENLLKTIHLRGASGIYGCMVDGELCAAAFFGMSQTRAIFLVSVANEKGKENRSMFKLVDSFIREHSGSSLLLDFEGSNIPNVARFFAGFGARQEIYQAVSFSRLPRIVNRMRGHG